jgi:hypothetical protein
VTLIAFNLIELQGDDLRDKPLEQRNWRRCWRAAGVLSARISPARHWRLAVRGDRNQEAA